MKKCNNIILSYILGGTPNYEIVPDVISASPVEVLVDGVDSHLVILHSKGKILFFSR